MDTDVELINRLDRLFECMEPLFRKSYFEQTVSPIENGRLNSCLLQWHDIEGCIDKLNCAPNKCQFAKPLEWANAAGHENLCDLILEKNDDESPSSIPQGGGGDMFSRGRRRPGHFNP